MSAFDVVRDHYAASDRGDLDAMLAPLGPDAAWTEMAGFPYAGTYHGPDGVRAGVFMRIGEDWDGYRFDLDELVDGGDVIVGIGTYSGTCKATGKSMRARVAHVWRLENDVVVAFEQFADTLLVDRAMRTD